jgi:integrase
MLRKKLLALFDQEHGEWFFPSPKRCQIRGKPESHIRDVKNAFRRAVNLAGIRPITFHQLGHTFCSRLADAGVSMPVIQDLAGHASITMTRRYTHPADERKQQAVEALLGSPKGLEPATETPKSSGGQIVEVANGSRSIT